MTEKRDSVKVERLTVNRASMARMLDVSPSTVRNLQAKGMPYLKVTGGILFPVQEVRSWIAKNTQRG